jgi:hypothetical protein
MKLSIMKKDFLWAFICLKNSKTLDVVPNSSTWLSSYEFQNNNILSLTMINLNESSQL